MPLLVALSLLADAAALAVAHGAVANGSDGRYVPAGLQIGTLALYLLGCAVAAREPRRFARRFASKVRTLAAARRRRPPALPFGRLRSPSHALPCPSPAFSKVRNAEVSGISPPEIERLLLGPPATFEHRLFGLCKERGIAAVFQRERREHALRCVGASRSVRPPDEPLAQCPQLPGCPPRAARHSRRWPSP